jgi:hypothetical protein
MEGILEDGQPFGIPLHADRFSAIFLTQRATIAVGDGGEGKKVLEVFVSHFDGENAFFTRCFARKTNSPPDGVHQKQLSVSLSIGRKVTESSMENSIR